MTDWCFILSQMMRGSPREPSLHLTVGRPRPLRWRGGGSLDNTTQSYIQFEMFLGGPFSSSLVTIGRCRRTIPYIPIMAHFILPFSARLVLIGRQKNKKKIALELDDAVRGCAVAPCL